MATRASRGGIDSLNIQLLKYNIEFNKQEALTMVPSDGRIIISLFYVRFCLRRLLLVEWWEIDIFFSTSTNRVTSEVALAPFRPIFNFFFIISTSNKKLYNFNLMIPCEIAAYSTWRTIAIRIELNVNRRHDGTFMKMTLNSASLVPLIPKKKWNKRKTFSLNMFFDLWKTFN